MTPRGRGASVGRGLAANKVREERGAEVRREIMAEAELLGITVYENTIPKLPRKKSKFTGFCGCDEGVDLDLSLHELERLNLVAKERGIDGPYCNQCQVTRPRLAMEELLKEKGGKIMSERWSFGHKAEFKCDNPLHPPFKAYPTNVLHGGSWCPTCAYESRANAASDRWAEIAATFGCRLDSYLDAHHATFILPDGTAKQTRPNNFPKIVPITSNTVSIAVKDRRAFVYAGDPPSNMPRVLEWHFDGAEIIHREICGSTDLQTKQITLKVFGDTIEKLANPDARINGPGLPEWELEVLNVWRNHQWIAPATYKWGRLEETFFTPNHG